MATKKTDSAELETTTSETATSEAAGGEKLVSIKLFKDNGRYKGDLFVSVNGVNYLIKRGMTVQVPEYVAEVIQHSMEQDEMSAARLANIVNQSE